MDRNELTNLIKAIALEEIEKKRTSHLPNSDKKILVLVPQTVFSYGKFFDYIKKVYGEDTIHIASYHVKVRFSSYADPRVTYLDVTNLAQRQTLFDGIEAYEKACVLLSDLNAVGDLLEIRDTALSQIVNYLIMQDKPIEALWDYKIENKRMKEIRNNQKKLECLGIVSQNMNKEKANRKTVKKVITERDVFDAHSRSVKVIEAANQLVTPLAKDRARELKIVIQQTGR